MFLHGDGRTNLIYRSSLLENNETDKKVLNYIHSLKPTKCIINPPYENNGAFDFTWQAIDFLENNGKLIIIMPSNTLEKNLKYSLFCKKQTYFLFHQDYTHFQKEILKIHYAFCQEFHFFHIFYEIFF